MTGICLSLCFKNQQKWKEILWEVQSAAFVHLRQCPDLVVHARVWNLVRASTRYQTGNCNLRMGWTFPRHRKVSYHYQHTRSVQVFALNTAYLGHTSSRKMNSCWNSYIERSIETKWRGELILQRRLEVFGDQGQECLSLLCLTKTWGEEVTVWVRGQCWVRKKMDITSYSYEPWRVRDRKSVV